LGEEQILIYQHQGQVKLGEEQILIYQHQGQVIRQSDGP